MAVCVLTHADFLVKLTYIKKTKREQPYINTIGQNIVLKQWKGYSKTSDSSATIKVGVKMPASLTVCRCHVAYAISTASNTCTGPEEAGGPDPTLEIDKWL